MQLLIKDPRRNIKIVLLFIVQSLHQAWPADLRFQMLSTCVDSIVVERIDAYHVVLGGTCFVVFGED